MLSPQWSLSLTLNFCSDSLHFSPAFLPPLLFPNRKRRSVGNYRCYTLQCRLAKVKKPPTPSADALIKEPHKYFDQVIITVRSGDGGHGAILTMPNQRAPPKSQEKYEKDKTKKKISYKRDFDGSLILPKGGHGGDVVIYADESKDTLLEFHKQSRYNAKRGGNVAAMGVLTSQLNDGLAAPELRIPISLLDIPEHRRNKAVALTTNLLRDDNDKVLVHGQPGEEVSLQLILRVVADVGLVGLPNAGKSTLLAAITLAKPDIADYPFTTLMPNLGRLGGDPSLGAAEYSSEATLADLPGLIEGAHLGKGLGRNFLRHLRRTRLLVHVVDAAAKDPVNDYRTVKEELRMYNPDYLERPYVVVLNKIDIPEALERLPHLTEEIWKIGQDRMVVQAEANLASAASSVSKDRNQANGHSSELIDQSKKVREIEEYPRPLAVVGVSVLKSIMVNEMLREIRSALRKCRENEEALKLPDS